MPTVPAGIVADGSLRVWVCTTVANTSAPAVAAELNAGTSVPLAEYTAGFAPDASVATITDDRLALSVVLEDKGVATWSIEEVTYVIDPQTPASTSNKLYAALPEDSTRYLVARYGLPYDTAPAAGQRVDVFVVKCGPPVKLPPERNSKLRAKQKLFITQQPVRDVALVA